MPTTEEVEVAAKVILNLSDLDYVWDNAPDGAHETYRLIALAALEAAEQARCR